MKGVELVRRQFWQRAIALLLLAVTFSLIDQAIPPATTADGTLLRIAVTIVWVAVSVLLISSMRRIGLAGLKMEPQERRPVLHLAMQLLLAVLAVIAILVVASAWRFSLSGLALGGAFTGVVVGLAAQSTLGNAIAGMMLLTLRPFRVGELVSLHIAGWDCAGRVEEVNFFYTVVRDGSTRRVVPNLLVASSPANVTENEQEPAQTLVLPYRVAPEEALAVLQPLKSAEVVDLRVDAYALRVEWHGEQVGTRLAALARLVGRAG